MNKKFTGKTILAELLENPKTRKVLEEHNIPCVSCPFAQMEMDNLTIKEICGVYGISWKNLLKDLNKL
ncbi:MAG TPA: hypothetical protein ENL27_02520 [Candidatus Parcubacteria bacterium]|nr:hypothetical protein [Candidatus Parcubacteria bacterium]